MKTLLISIFVVLLIVTSRSEEGQHYFPEGAFSKEFAAGFASTLQLAEEKPLIHTKANVRRLLYMPCFNDIIVFRLETQAYGEGVLTTKRLKRIPDSKNDFIIHYKYTKKATIRLSQLSMQNFLSFFEQARFFSLPTKDPSFRAGNLDGSTWIFEAVNDEKYNVTERWSPMPPDLRNPPKKCEEFALDMASLYLFLVGGAQDDVIY